MKTDKQSTIKQILNYVYENCGEAPPMDGDLEKIQIFNELLKNRVISECDITTTPILADPNEKVVITKSKGYLIDKQMAEQLYGINIPS